MCTVHEFSIESLLYLLEYKQVLTLILRNKANIYNEIINSNKTTKKEFIDKLSKYNKFKISDDILGLDSGHTIQLTYNDIFFLFYYLYDHYIKTESIQCINISSEFRQNIFNLFNNYKTGDDVPYHNKSNILFDLIEHFHAPFITMNNNER